MANLPVFLFELMGKWEILSALREIQELSAEAAFFSSGEGS
jgi:hypothetical protein